MRKAILFTFDALLASLLLVAGVVVISQHFQESVPTVQTAQYSHDALAALNVIRVRDVNDSWVRSQIASGVISDGSKTVLEQIGVFWATNDTARAANLSAVLLDQLLPSGYGYSLKMGGEVLYEQNYSSQRMRTVGRRMITGIEKGEALQGSTGTAYLSKIQSKRTAKHAYFGGFVGQGNLSVRLDGLPADLTTGNVTEVLLEGEFDEDFSLRINGEACGGTYTTSGADLVIDSYNVTSCANLFRAGNNTVEVIFTGSVANASVSGGFLRVSYQTSEFQEAQEYGVKTTYLPGIKGVINVYDGFYTPGSLNNLTINLHYWVDAANGLPIFFDLGNTTVYTANQTGEVNVTLTDGYLRSQLTAGGMTYAAMSNATVPLRFGFYEGNSTNSSGNITDVFVVTSRHYSMGTNDIVVDPTTNRTRMAQVKDLDDLFIDIVLNSTGNQVGLVSFGTGSSVDLDSALSTDNASLHAAVAGYSPHSADAQRNLCGALELAKGELVAAGGARKRTILFMTDGDIQKPTGNTDRCDGSPTSDLGLLWEDVVQQACDATDPVHGNPENITFFAVAFGPEAANTPHIVANLTKMANCTGGQFALGSNASELEEIYRNFSLEIAKSSIAFTFQRATVADNVASRLYGDSRIVAYHTPIAAPPSQQQIPVTFQTPQFGTCTPAVDIFSGLTVTDAKLLSYSGDYWTKGVSVDGTTVYNLSAYLANYSRLGDPFLVQVPSNLLGAGTHSLGLSIGANDSSSAGCSLNSSLVYTANIQASTSRSGVLPDADGCDWHVEFEDGSFLDVSVPSNYSGGNACNYTSSSIAYNSKDAYDVAVHSLLDNLDFDDDGRVFVNLGLYDLEIIVTLVTSVPYLWGPTIATLEVWR